MLFDYVWQDGGGIVAASDPGRFNGSDGTDSRDGHRIEIRE
jgi:hypothetical protein